MPQHKSCAILSSIVMVSWLHKHKRMEWKGTAMRRIGMVVGLVLVLCAAWAHAGLDLGQYCWNTSQLNGTPTLDTLRISAQQADGNTLLVAASPSRWRAAP